MSALSFELGPSSSEYSKSSTVSTINKRRCRRVLYFIVLPLTLTAIGVSAYYIYQSTLLVDFAYSEQCRVNPADRVKDDAGIRVLTYNIAGAGGARPDGMDGFDIDRITSTISSINADIVCLQEVGPKKVATPTQAQAIAEKLGMCSYFAKSNPYLGNAILSKWPMTSYDVIDAFHGSTHRDNGKEWYPETRNAVAAKISPVDGEEEKYDFYVVNGHIGNYNTKDTERGKMFWPMDRISAYITSGDRKDRPAILCGDMNDKPDGYKMARASRDWNMYPEWESVPTSKKGSRIDYVLDRNQDGAYEMRYQEVVTEDEASDHKPLFADWGYV